jgi:hypothetical protein
MCIDDEVSTVVFLLALPGAPASDCTSAPSYVVTARPASSFPSVSTTCLAADYGARRSFRAETRGGGAEGAKAAP